MRPLNTALLFFVVVGAAAAQSADPLLLYRRLSVHTLVREDIFAGFRNNNRFHCITRANCCPG